MWPVFDQALARYQDLERQLSDPGVIADRARFAQTAKEHGKLARMIKPYLEFRKVADDVAQAEAMKAAADDPEMQHLADEELAQLRPRRQELQTRLEDFLLIEPGEDFGSVILE